MLAVLITVSVSLSAITSTHATLPVADRLDRLGDGVAADVLGEVVERPAGEHGQGDASPPIAAAAAQDTVPSPPPTASTSARSAAERERLHDVVVLTEFDDLGLRQGLADLVDDPRARCRCPTRG